VPAHDHDECIQLDKRLMQESPEYLRRRSVVFLGHSPHDGKLHIGGSGVLLEIAGEHFILTAAHVLAFRAQAKIPLYLDSGDTPARLVGLTPENTRAVTSISPSGDIKHRDDPCDAAAIHISQVVVDAIKDNRTFLRLEQIDPNDADGKHSFYMAHGYPEATLNHVDDENLALHALSYGGSAIRANKGELVNYDPELHLGVAFDRDNAITPTGKVIDTPHPEGMSGCGIWRLYQDGADKKTWSVKDIRLVGIEHSWKHDPSFLKGLRIKWLLGQIYREFKHLQKSMAVHLGTSWPTRP
jgi:hypothetical protein